MGIRGSSTCPLTSKRRACRWRTCSASRARPQDRLQHLEPGRLKLGAGVLGGMKLHLAGALNYVADRKQFDTPIVRFAYAREAGAHAHSRVLRGGSRWPAAPRATHRRRGGGRRGRWRRSRNTTSGRASEGAWQRGARRAHRRRRAAARRRRLHREYPIERAYRDARASTASSRAPTRSTGCSSPARCSEKRTLKGKVDLRRRRADAFAEGRPGREPEEGGAVGAPVRGRGARAKLEHHQAVLAAVSDLIMDAFALDAMAAPQPPAREEARARPWRTAALQRWSNDAHARALQWRPQRRLSCVRGDELTQRLKDAIVAGVCPSTPRRTTVPAAAVNRRAYYPDSPFDRAGLELRVEHPINR